MDEWMITSEWTMKMDDIIHNHMNSALCARYHDLHIVNEHEFYLAPDSGDLSSIRIFIGVTNEDIGEHEANLELFGATGLVAIPNSIYGEMYHHPSVMTNFELAMGDVLDRISKQSRHWLGDCGIIHELKTYITMHINAVKK